MGLRISCLFEPRDSANERYHTLTGRQPAPPVPLAAHMYVKLILTSINFTINSISMIRGSFVPHSFAGMTRLCFNPLPCRKVRLLLRFVTADYLPTCCGPKIFRIRAQNSRLNLKTNANKLQVKRACSTITTHSATQLRVRPCSHHNVTYLWKNTVCRHLGTGQ